MLPRAVNITVNTCYLHVLLVNVTCKSNSNVCVCNLILKCKEYSKLLFITESYRMEQCLHARLAMNALVLSARPDDKSPRGPK